MRREGGEQFLNEKYSDLQASQEVESAVKRQEIRSSEKTRDKNDKVEAYLGRLEEIFDVENPKRERRVEFLKNKLHENFVIKPDEIPESYFKHQQQIARERGYGDIEVTDEMRRQVAETIRHDQAQSLDAWVDYFGSPDATYPNWLKYFAFRSITKLAEYDKEKKEFKKRSKGTTANFPDINREALSYVLDEVEKSHTKGVRENTDDEQWEKALKNANFGKLYAQAIEKITPASEEEKENIQGEWIKYEQGSDAEPLYKSLQGHGTGWCTAGEGVAKAQLETGDFYVFYSKDKSGQPKIPRVAIRMENGEIAEVRGINADQNLEGSMTEIAKEKTKTLPGGEKYDKKTEDMRRLTEIEKKFISTKNIEGEIENLTLIPKRSGDDGKVDDQIDKLKADLKQIELENQKVELTKEELRFLYGMDGPIEGFGYQKDPRVDEILANRNDIEDYIEIYKDNSKYKNVREKWKKLLEIKKKLYPILNIDKQIYLLEIKKEDRMADGDNYDDSDAEIDELKKKYNNEGNVTLSKEELRFLYEIDERIEIFDTQAEEITRARDKNKDYSIIFDCDPDDVALYAEELGDSTLVFVGNLIAGKINKIPINLKYVVGDVGFGHSKFEELPHNLTFVSGSLVVGSSRIKALPLNLNFIGRDLNIRDSQIKSIPLGLNYIGRTVMVDKGSALDFSKVKIGGEIIYE